MIGRLGLRRYSSTMLQKKPLDYLKKFLMKVHPDLLPSPQAQTENANSLATLNAIIDVYKPAKYRTDSIRDMPVKRSKLKFHFLSPAEHGSTSPTTQVITSMYTPPVIGPGEDSSIAFPAIEKLLLDLFEQANVEVEPSDKHRWVTSWETTQRATEKSQQHGNEGQQRRRHGFYINGRFFENSRPTNPAVSNAQFQDYFREKLQYKDFREVVDKEPRYTLVESMMESKLVRFDPELSEFEKMAAARAFDKVVSVRFNELQCYAWMGVPIRFHRPELGYITPAWDAADGFIFQVPYNFKEKLFLKYMKKSVKLLDLPENEDEAMPEPDERDTPDGNLSDIYDVLHTMDAEDLKQVLAAHEQNSPSQRVLYHPSERYAQAYSRTRSKERKHFPGGLDPSHIEGNLYRKSSKWRN